MERGCRRSDRWWGCAGRRGSRRCRGAAGNFGRRASASRRGAAGGLRGPTHRGQRAFAIRARARGAGRATGRHRSARRTNPGPPQPRTAACRSNDRRPRSHSGRRRQRQDARASPSSGLPRRSQGRAAVADPGCHLHQQSRRRVARPNHRPRGRGSRSRSRHGHVPRPVRPSSSAGWRRCRARPPLCRLRLGRPAGPDEADPAGGRPADHRRIQTELDSGCHLAGQERDARSRLHSRERPHSSRAGDRPALPALPDALEGGRCARLRRPPARGRTALPGRPFGPGALSDPVALPPHRRVPGHQPAAIPVGQGPCGWSQELMRRRRRRSVDLLLARSRHPQHPGLRSRLPGCDRRQARAELPLHPADPGCRACGRRS